MKDIIKKIEDFKKEFSEIMESEVNCSNYTIKEIMKIDFDSSGDSLRISIPKRSKMITLPIPFDKFDKDTDLKEFLIKLITLIKDYNMHYNWYNMNKNNTDQMKIALDIVKKDGIKALESKINEELESIKENKEYVDSADTFLKENKIDKNDLMDFYKVLKDIADKEFDDRESRSAYEEHILFHDRSY